MLDWCRSREKHQVGEALLMPSNAVKHHSLLCCVQQSDVDGE